LFYGTAKFCLYQRIEAKPVQITANYWLVIPFPYKQSAEPYPGKISDLFSLPQISKCILSCIGMVMNGAREICKSVHAALPFFIG
jgi:hypothetical protein